MCVCYPNTLCKCAGILCDGSYIHLPRPCAWGRERVNLHYPVGQRGKGSDITSVPFSGQGHSNKIIHNGTVNGNCRATECGDLSYLLICVGLTQERCAEKASHVPSSDTLRNSSLGHSRHPVSE